MARELHDVVAYALDVIIMQAGALASSPGWKRPRPKLCCLSSKAGPRFPQIARNRGSEPCRHSGIGGRLVKERSGGPSWRPARPGSGR